MRPYAVSKKRSPIDEEKLMVDERMSRGEFEPRSEEPELN